VTIATLTRHPTAETKTVSKQPLVFEYLRSTFIHKTRLYKNAAQKVSNVAVFLADVLRVLGWQSQSANQSSQITRTEQNTIMSVRDN